MGRIRACAWPEFLRAAPEDFGRVEIAVRVDGELVDRPEQPRRRAVRAPRVEQTPVQVVFHQLVEWTREDPQELIVADMDVVRLRDVRELIEVLAVLVKYLDA